jgi:YD repeat-containing protein
VIEYTYLLKVREPGGEQRRFTYEKQEARDAKADEARKHGFEVEVGTIEKEVMPA